MPAKVRKAPCGLPFGKNPHGVAELPDLTPRERDVLVALCAPAHSQSVFTEPASVREIAAALVVTDAAVKQHLLHLYEKFGIDCNSGRRRVALAKEAIGRGVMDLDVPDSSVLAAGRTALEREEWEVGWRVLV